MKIFVFNRKKEYWLKAGEYEIEELEIVNGLMLTANGYDSTSMTISYENETTI